VAFPWWLDGRDARPMCEALAREGALTAPRECFDASEHFRIGFGGQASGFQDALDIASRVFDSRSGLQPTALVPPSMCGAHPLTLYWRVVQSRC
jgi:hypothetical protein